MPRDGVLDPNCEQARPFRSLSERAHRACSAAAHGAFGGHSAGQPIPAAVGGEFVQDAA